MAVLIPDKLHQSPGLIQIVVDSPHQTVLKGKTAACLLIIVMAGLQHIMQFIGARYGHKGFPHLVIGRMKGKSQSHRQTLLCKFPDARNNPAGRYGKTPLADIQPLVMGNQTQKADDIVIVIHRLP